MVAMVAEPLQNTQLESSGTNGPALAVPPGRHKYRLRFRKGGDLRLVSHHDLMHVFERMLRRAALPIAHTQGFHPQPRMVFALSLALGITGCNEVIELEMTEDLPAEELHRRLVAQAPAGLEILGIKALTGKSSSLVRRAFYRLPLDLAAADVLQSLPSRCQSLLSQTHLRVERSRPQPRILDIRPYLCDLTCADGHLDMAIWVTPTGTARPEEYARLLGLEPLLEAGVVFERAHLEMLDEVADGQPELMPTTTSENTQPEDLETAWKVPEKTAAPTPPAPPTALLPGPLSFDS
jgi:radical SAM-linked protein